MSNETIHQTRIPAADGRHTTNGTPHGFSSLTPFLSVGNAKAAIDFYRDVFGARVLGVTASDGVVHHAELDFGNGRLQLGEPAAEFHLVPAPEGEDDCYAVGLYCPNADEVVARAVAAGASIREAPSTFVSGDRFASIRDPFGVRWSIMTRVEDLSQEESDARVAEWAKGLGDE
ncbi:VOC family protein [Gordonia sp. (in: high G+C Gram-positive bacteria)]|uniref:VOC family protein n=1 Tax=Gordonia sp. (in: high G+C Gram-positive bacteria) TaxID=84139 RepID=UPI0039E247FF